jgi:hypothetical protein
VHDFRKVLNVMPPHDDILDDLFHGCALAAYVELAIVAGGTPDSEETRRLAFEFYEAALAARQTVA